MFGQGTTLTSRVARLASTTTTRGVGNQWELRFKPHTTLFDKLDNWSHTDNSPIQFDIGSIFYDGRLFESLFNITFNNIRFSILCKINPK